MNLNEVYHGLQVEDVRPKIVDHLEVPNGDNVPRIEVRRRLIALRLALAAEKSVQVVVSLDLRVVQTNADLQLDEGLVVDLHLVVRRLGQARKGQEEKLEANLHRLVHLLRQRKKGQEEKLEADLHRLSQMQTAKWLEENGPRVEVNRGLLVHGRSPANVSQRRVKRLKIVQAGRGRLVQRNVDSWSVKRSREIVAHQDRLVHQRGLTDAHGWLSKKVKEVEVSLDLLALNLNQRTVSPWVVLIGENSQDPVQIVLPHEGKQVHDPRVPHDSSAVDHLVL